MKHDRPVNQKFRVWEELIGPVEITMNTGKINDLKIGEPVDLIGFVIGKRINYGRSQLSAELLIRFDNGETAYVPAHQIKSVHPSTDNAEFP